ncbi:hypothetical protein [Streptomyces sp. CS-7]|uniref:hypothetical protein n=1 Tax=Streptomyces sp. CS-7 TaxID=2906769 RepID=UPI0037DA7504
MATLPVYRWRLAPDGLATRRQLRALGLRPGGQDVAAQLERPRRRPAPTRGRTPPGRRPRASRGRTPRSGPPGTSPGANCRRSASVPTTGVVRAVDGTTCTATDRPRSL